MMIGQIIDVVLSARKPLTRGLHDRIEERPLCLYRVSQEGNPCCMPRNCLKIIIPADSLENAFGWLFGNYT